MPRWKSVMVLPGLLKKSFLGFSFFACLFLLPGNVRAEATEKDLMTRIQQLEKKLDEIQKQQAAILDKQKELSEKLDTVKVWAHRG